MVQYCVGPPQANRADSVYFDTDSRNLCSGRLITILSKVILSVPVLMMQVFIISPKSLTGVQLRSNLLTMIKIFSLSSNYPVIPHAVEMGVLLSWKTPSTPFYPIRIETFHHRTMLISQKNINIKWIVEPNHAFKMLWRH